MAPVFTGSFGVKMEDLLKVGVITTTHGVRGEVKVYPTTDDQSDFLIWNMFCWTQEENFEDWKYRM